MRAAPAPEGRLAPERVDRFLAAWGQALTDTVGGESRGKLSTELFDIPRRSCVGYACAYELVPDLVREIERHRQPEELGSRMRRFGSRPYYLNCFVLMSSYLLGREQLLLDRRAAGEAGDPTPFEDLALVVDFFQRMMGAYYAEPGRTEPRPEDWSQRVVGEEEWQRCEELLAEPSSDRLAAGSMLSGVVSLYALMLHGENRDGNFEHGPYRTAGGGIAIANDFNDLSNEFLPWAEPAVRLGVDNLSVVTEYDDVAVRFNMFGGAITDPPDPSDRIRRMAIFTRTESGLRPLDRVEVARLVEQARSSQLLLYERALAMEPAERSRYGIFLYANHLRPFAALAGAGAASEGLLAEWLRVGEPHAAALAMQAEKPRLWVHLAALEERMFSPLEGPAHGASPAPRPTDRLGIDFSLSGDNLPTSRSVNSLNEKPTDG